jgi:hypothetical protein
LFTALTGRPLILALTPLKGVRVEPVPRTQHAGDGDAHLNGAGHEAFTGIGAVLMTVACQ